MEKFDWQSAAREYPHPFVHEVKLSRAQRIRGIILGSILCPLRVTLAAFFFLIMWPFAWLRLAWLSEEERSRPVTGWRRWLFHPIIWLLSRAVFFSLGFVWVKVKGHKVDLKKAPVLVVAPHSSFLDMLVLCPAQLATVVSRSENKSLPVIGALLEFNQSVLVSRKDPESRKNAVAQLTERLTSNGYWPQMLMFPEGTTTNGRALIKFKPGAFLAGVPVQPVLLRYPNKLVTLLNKTLQWPFCPHHWRRTMVAFFLSQFLPVYNPSQEEKNNPNLYADNVQKLMAKALGVPATDYVMEGRVPVSKLGGLSLPLDSPARETLSLLGASEVQAALERMIDKCQSGAQESKASAEELASILGLTDRKTAATICGLYSKDETVDLRNVYLSVATVSGLVSFKSLLHTAFTLFDREGRGSLSEQNLSDLLGALLGVVQHNTKDFYTEASKQGQLTEGNLLQVLTTHPTYQRIVNEYLQPEAGSRLSFKVLASEKAVNNNGNTVHKNESLHYNKKSE
uniref:Lysophosphatidylcholine acyltransferase 4 n=1 Tax=Mastacembelus armatus TaxID=205130 RepID=A0A3Q3LSA5_9TELE